MPRSEIPALEAPDHTAVERWLLANLAPQRLESARGLYELMPLQRDGQLPFVDVRYDAYSEAHWAEATRIADYVAHLPVGGTRILDIGPGDGWPSLPVAAAVPGADIVGIDPSPTRVAVSTANGRRLGLANAHFVTGDGTQLPFATSSFDLVIAASSIEEADDGAAVLAEAARVLKPGGVLRASYQNWRLEAPDLESVLLWEGRGTLLYTYVRRRQTPPIERRYTLVLPHEGPAAEVHERALIAAANGTRFYGETLLSLELGVPLLEALAPHVVRSTLVEMRRWTTADLVTALRGVGFADVRPTVHPGELGRRFARDLIARGAMAEFAPLFADATTALGGIAGSQRGDAMVAAVR
jgi:ubiquinone/menaquinone biosynthesis C-methylase UbiE